MAPDQNAAARDRVITHMNKDHAPELSRYLRHYASLPSRAASGPVLTGLTLENMTIRTADGKSHVVRLDPPMRSYADSRRRAVEMDAAAREGLGLGDVEVDEYAPPRGLDLFIGAFAVSYLGCYLALPWQVPGSALRSFWDAVVPGGAAMQEWAVRKIFLPLLGIHLAEIVLLDRTRLAKYGVERGSGVWWKWAASCLLEGFPSFGRFDRMVREKREAMGKTQ